MDHWGGTCINVGCVPSKTILRIGELYNYVSKVLGHEHYPEFMEIFAREREVVNELRRLKYEDVLAKYDVELVKGKAYFTSSSTVKVNGKVIEARRFIIATGASPKILEIPGLKEVGYWTNIEALNPDRKVDSLVIIGGRAQALEFAQMYRRLGVDVAIVQRSPTLIPDWEPELALEAQRMLEDEGVLVITNAKVLRVSKGSGKVVITDKGEIEADEILFATGRRPNIDLNLEAAGVKLNDKGGILVDDELRTTNPRIYAAGDVIGGPMLEALAGKQGVVAVDNAVLNTHRRIDMMSVPQAIFTQPNLARVGLTFMEASKAGINADYRVVWMRDVAKAHILGDTRGLIKMIIDKSNMRIIGVHVMAENAAEFIDEAALAIRLRATVDDIIDTVHIFPTMAESLKLAAQAFRRDISKLSCCVD
ncbi:mercury(II) reductase [Vulcanisaeta souniana JCM 11219]|uniref:Mercuric reductase n=1 Tax=Vulcanisaeta souniana JCM 11219 TaxID=1293586 RepID=A0A830E1N9_9CREN|nr:mercury(II) reductase [Vulcanisaeta souniana JCM 11219]GGI73613.1 mercury(II) reductase [Vulcanisaeta souniana JCM 11219]